jgi:competence protein ComEC
LIDAGNNDKATLVVNYLKKQGINKIDILIGTHPDADHIGGLDAVIDNFDIGKIYMPKVQSNTKTFEDVLLAIQRKGLKVTTAKAGVTLDWESDTNVEMIAPVAQYSDTNDMSAVIHLTYGQTSFLFTGDAESKSEKDMIDSKINLKSDVLLVGHHGSNSSSSQAFLDAVKPTYAVIQVGKSNNYGHPTDEVLKRLTDRGIKTYRTDEQGNIIFTTNGKDIVIKYDNGITVPIKGELAPTLTNSPKVKPSEAPVIYKNCTEVKAAGKAPLLRGDPGYSSKLDRDNDGVACE